MDMYNALLGLPDPQLRYYYDNLNTYPQYGPILGTNSFWFHRYQNQYPQYSVYWNPALPWNQYYWDTGRLIQYQNDPVYLTQNYGNRSDMGNVFGALAGAALLGGIAGAYGGRGYYGGGPFGNNYGGRRWHGGGRRH